MSRYPRRTDPCSLIHIIGCTAGLRLCATVCFCNRMKGGGPTEQEHPDAATAGAQRTNENKNGESLSRRPGKHSVIV